MDASVEENRHQNCEKTLKRFFLKNGFLFREDDDDDFKFWIHTDEFFFKILCIGINMLRNTFMYM